MAKEHKNKVVDSKIIWHKNKLLLFVFDKYRYYFRYPQCFSQKNIRIILISVRGQLSGKDRIISFHRQLR